jgi:hypothetical protein
MSDNVGHGQRSMSLREQYGKRQTCWQDKQEPIFRAWLDGEGAGLSYGFPFFSLLLAAFSEKDSALSLQFPTGTLLVKGPKAQEFYEAFCANRATALKSDGADILSVEFFPVGLDAPKE